MTQHGQRGTAGKAECSGQSTRRCRPGARASQPAVLPLRRRPLGHLSLSCSCPSGVGIPVHLAVCPVQHAGALRRCAVQAVLVDVLQDRLGQQVARRVALLQLVPHLQRMQQAAVGRTISSPESGAAPRSSSGRVRGSAAQFLAPRAGHSGRGGAGSEQPAQLRPGRCSVDRRASTATAGGTRWHMWAGRGGWPAGLVGGFGVLVVFP